MTASARTMLLVGAAMALPVGALGVASAQFAGPGAKTSRATGAKSDASNPLSSKKPCASLDLDLAKVSEVPVATWTFKPAAH